MWKYQAEKFGPLSMHKNMDWLDMHRKKWQIDRRIIGNAAEHFVTAKERIMHLAKYVSKTFM